jgi:hypothetical protein
MANTAGKQSESCSSGTAKLSQRVQYADLLTQEDSGKYYNSCILLSGILHIAVHDIDVWLNQTCSLIQSIRCEQIISWNVGIISVERLPWQFL